MKIQSTYLYLILFPVLLFGQYSGGSGDGFAVWTSATDISLPVQLSAYRFIISDDRVETSWVTSAELNNLGFRISRKMEDEREFVELSSYKSNPDLVGKGNSDTGSSYHFIDLDVMHGVNYTYQIHSADYSGELSLLFTFAARLNDDAEAGVPSEFHLWQNYPNPFNPSTTLLFGIPFPGEVNISIYTVNGELIEQITNQYFEAGTHRWKYTPGFQLSTGSYICRIEYQGLSNFIRMVYIK